MVRISFVGLGVVGTTFSERMIANGAIVKGFDIKVGLSSFEDRVKKCREIGIDVVDSMELLAKDAELILVATAPSVALETAESVKPYLHKGQTYVDLNSAVPAIKKNIDSSLAEIGVDVVDGTAMSSINMDGYNAILNFSGPRARDVVKILKAYGLNANYFGDTVGEACAFKVVRSIFMKGYEAVLMECVEAAYHYGVVDNVLRSIAQYFDPKPSAAHFDLFINTDAVFAKRRGEEVDAVAKMLADDGINNIMSEAIAHKLGWISALGLSDYYNHEAPHDMHGVIKLLCAREKELGGRT